MSTSFNVLCLIFLLPFVRSLSLSDLMITTRSVISPTIVSPNSSSVWLVGTHQLVVWKTDNIPPDDQITNPVGRIVLGHLGSTGGLNLDLDHPLAGNLSYKIGQVEIVVPDVPPRNDYIVVLFGDSGNAGPAFVITEIATDGSTPQIPLVPSGTGQSTQFESMAASSSSPATTDGLAPWVTASPAITESGEGQASANLKASMAVAISQQLATMTVSPNAFSTTPTSLPSSAVSQFSGATPPSWGPSENIFFVLLAPFLRLILF